MTRLSIISLVCLVSLAPVMAASQSGQVIRNVSVTNTGAGTIDENFILAHISSKEETELNKQAISKDIKALLDTGLFTSVDARTEQVEDGIRLIFSLRNRSKLGERIAVSGAEYLRESKIVSLIGLEIGDPVDDQVLSTRANRVLEAYRKDHYPDAEVTWKTEETDKSQGLVRVSAAVNEGKWARVDRVVFVGNEAIPSRTLIKAWNPPAWWNPFSWFRTMRYDPDELEIARLEVRDLFRGKGYLDAEVDTPIVARTQGGSLVITVNIKEGVLYRVGKISLSGITLFAETELWKTLNDRTKLRTGDIADPMIIDRSAQALRDYYGSRGYINTTVRPVLNPVKRQEQGKAEGEVDVRFVFTEGNLVKIRNIDIRGNTRTRDKVIRRELMVYPGEVFDEVKVRTSQMRLMNLGYFKEVRPSPVETRDPAQDDLLLEVEEKQTGMMSAGVGFSSVDRLSGFFSVSQENFDLAGWPYFTGAGQKLKISAQVGETTRDYELSFIEPWFLDRKLSLGFDLFRREVSYSEYDVDRTGAGISLGKALSGDNRVDFQYRIERVVLSEISDTNEYFYLEPYTADITSNSYYFTSEETHTTESSLSITLTHDTRDNPFSPSRGVRASVSASISGGPLGFNTDVYELSVSGVQYVPLWFKHVLSLRAKCQVVEEYGDTEDVPVGDRLFMGGARTLRGYDYRDVGPKVVRTYATNDTVEVVDHKPVGGKTLALASAEYTMPVISMIKFACFYDIGNVWQDAYEVDLRHLASGAGIGLRFDIPGFPMRIDRTWSIKKDNPLTDEDTWVFWIGYPY